MGLGTCNEAPPHNGAASASTVYVWSFRLGLSTFGTFSISRSPSTEELTPYLTTSMCQNIQNHSLTLSSLPLVKGKSWNVHHIFNNRTCFKILHLSKYLEGEGDNLYFPKMPLVCMRVVLRTHHSAPWTEKQYCLLQGQGRESISHKFWVFTFPQILGKHEEMGIWGWLVISYGDNCHTVSPNV